MARQHSLILSLSLIISTISTAVEVKANDFPITPASPAITASKNVRTKSITGLIETTPDDPNWSLVTSDVILREKLCTPMEWYEKVFNPCYYPKNTRYWKLAQDTNVGKAFPMSNMSPGTFDGLFVRAGFGFQLYYNTVEPDDPCDLNEASPYMCGPQYVSIDYWRDVYPAPNGFEPATFFVHGGEGALSNYSIVIDNNEHCGNLYLNKIDDINDSDCVSPGREINYTITFNYNGLGDNNIRLIDYLPIEVDYNSSSPTGEYNEVDKTLTWNLGTLPPDYNGIFFINVFVNNLAEPNSLITNLCELKGDFIYTFTKLETAVCCWNPGIIYVDCNRMNGRNTGMSWKDAYLDLQDALERASCGGGSEIWVASGMYKTSVQYQDSLTFKLIDNIPLYGHFKGNEISISQRNLIDPNNETILRGEGVSSYYVVTASGFSQNNILDGFTIKKAVSAPSSAVKIENAYMTVSNCLLDNTGIGIYAFNANFSVTNCFIINNSSSGIISKESSFSVSDCNIQYNGKKGIEFDLNYRVDIPGSIIKRCIINNNSNYGIEHNRSTSTYSLIITECLISGNAVGVYALNGSSSFITNNWIYDNSYGIYLDNPGSTTIRNNTIVGNNNYGIYRYYGTISVITSSIIWGNPSGDLYGCSATYSWLNPNGDPCFLNPDANDFHLRPESLCIDMGDPCFMDFDVVDIDGDPRIKDGDGDCIWRVDIGADEAGISFSDFNNDGLVNFLDFALWANSWLTYDPAKSFDSDGDVDIDDLAKFCDEWLSYRSNPDFDFNNSVDFIDFGLLAESWQLFDADRSLDEDCDVDIDDLAIFCGHWLNESPWSE
ncbi:MAG: right-handed parallel beta-helix repeat-containing protein [Sedimentisphaerales bacterium]|nr:right-handed parallel beta-helix repeat-containing protein [Sedimentisphaerales bacterium]